MRRFTITPERRRDDQVTFDRRESHHLARVLRLKAGDTVVAVDGSGKVLAATDSGLSVSANSGSSFTSVTVPAPPRGIYAVGSTWYLPTSQGLSISTDAGSTWISYNGSQGVPPPAYDVLFSP